MTFDPTGILGAVLDALVESVLITDAEGRIAFANATTAVPPRLDGADTGRKTASLASLPLDPDQDHTIVLGVQERLELSLPVTKDACGSTYEGYLSANGELRALPAGSSLDRTGTFYWQPGPAFRGTYSLVFVRTACDGSRTKSHVSVSIR